MPSWQFQLQQLSSGIGCETAPLAASMYGSSPGPVKYTI
jgi:hypothetical protein